MIIERILEQLQEQEPIENEGPLSVFKLDGKYAILLEGPGQVDYEVVQRLEKNNPYPALVVCELEENWCEAMCKFFEEQDSEMEGIDMFYIEELQESIAASV